MVLALFLLLLLLVFLCALVRGKVADKWKWCRVLNGIHNTYVCTYTSARLREEKWQEKVG